MTATRPLYFSRRYSWLRFAFGAPCLAALGVAGCSGCEPPPPPPLTTASAVAPASAAPAVEVHRRCKTHCGINGGCSWDGARCVARSDADCRQAHACRVNGLCTNHGGFCKGTSDEDCKRSERCVNEGLCHFRGAHGATNCTAKTEADCQRSKQCTDGGRCTLYEGRCLSEPRTAPTHPVPD